MFNPNNTSNVENIWNYLGTFYDFLNKEDKKNIEYYWKALFNGLEGIYYDLYQTAFSNNLAKSPGYIEHNNIDLILNINNLEKKFLKPPKFKIYTSNNLSTELKKYFVTAKNIFGETNLVETLETYYDYPITIEILENIEEGIEYNIYRISNNNIYHVASLTNSSSYQENGEGSLIQKNFNINTALDKLIYELPVNNQIITIPQIKKENITLYENVDYTIEGKNYIVFNKSGIEKLNILNINEIKIEIPKILTLIPIITNFYLKVFGEKENPEKIIQSGFYSHYINETNQYNNKRYYALHLTRWVGAVINRLLKGPTLKNLKEVIALFYNCPFVYENDKILNITSDSNYKYITTEKFTYKIPKDFTVLKNVNDKINQFELLCNPEIELQDYVLNNNLQTYDLYIKVPLKLKFLNYYENFDILAENNYIRERLIPVNLKFIEEKVKEKIIIDSNNNYIITSNNEIIYTGS